MTDSGSGVFGASTTGFRISRDRLITRAQKLLADVEAERTRFAKETEEYEARVKAFLVENLDKLNRSFSIFRTYNGGSSITFTAPSELLESAGITAPEQNKFSNGRRLDVDAIRAELARIELGDGEYVPQKYADKLITLLTQAGA